MNKTNIIFLDCDGVLNSRKFFENRGDIRERYGDKGTWQHIKALDIDSNALRLMNKLCKETNSDVVLSSVWRLGRDVEELDGFFKSIGATFDVIGKTPDLEFKFEGVVRGNEIFSWLIGNCENIFDVYHNKFKNYVILDDNDDMLLHQAEHFFKTDPMYGLTNQTCDRVKRFFRNLEEGQGEENKLETSIEWFSPDEIPSSDLQGEYGFIVYGETKNCCSPDSFQACYKDNKWYWVAGEFPNNEIVNVRKWAYMPIVRSYE